MAKEFLPSMIKNNHGHIIGLASMASFVAPPAIIDYAATKAAVLAFHEGKSNSHLTSLIQLTLSLQV